MRFLIALLVVILSVIGTVSSASAQARGEKSRKPIANAFNGDAKQEPLFAEYKGVRIGMDAAEVRDKLGKPAIKADDGDYYIFSDTETAQIAYDETHKVRCISVDYTNGVGAPDYRNVVGSEMTVRPDGSIYKMVRYQERGFWVSYNRSVGPVVTVTITIQKT